ncbi:MAG: hypothetical protein LBD41_05055 [Clostridiales Family XIII bacterium]|jgi:hypothetical protein|nr:hypothetical protein [Clostridiales Family XIII bacterium]
MEHTEKVEKIERIKKIENMGKITIPCEIYSSKNSKRIVKNKAGKLFLVKSKQALLGDKEIKPYMIYFRDIFLEMTNTKPPPLVVRFKFYRRTRGRFDYINILQSLADNMVKYGWLRDDCADEFLPIFEQYEVDNLFPRIEISI